MLVMGARGQTGYVLGRSGGAAGNGLLTGLVAYWPLSEATALQSGSAIPFAVRVTRPQDDPTPDDVITIIRGAATIRARVSA